MRSYALQSRRLFLFRSIVCFRCVQWKHRYSWAKALKNSTSVFRCILILNSANGVRKYLLNCNTFANARNANVRRRHTRLLNEGLFWVVVWWSLRTNLTSLPRTGRCSLRLRIMRRMRSKRAWKRNWTESLDKAWKTAKMSESRQSILFLPTAPSKCIFEDICATPKVTRRELLVTSTSMYPTMTCMFRRSVRGIAQTAI